ncbi:MAG: AAA family ATPase [Candidatus Methanospirareceae archaeon]
MIDKIEIKNYRILENLKFEPARLNVFVGRNNTGKSSALEAIALTLSSLNGFKDVLENDLLDRLMGRRVPEEWQKGLNIPRFFISDKKNEGCVHVKAEGKDLRLDLQYLRRGIPKLDVGENFIDFLDEYSWKEALDEMRMFAPRELFGFRRAKPSVYEKEIPREFISDALNRRRMEIKKEIIDFPKLLLTGKLNNAIISEVACILKAEEEEETPAMESFERFNVLLEHDGIIPTFFRMNGLKEAEEVKALLGKLVRENKQERAIQLIQNEVEIFKDLREVHGELLCNLQSGTFPLTFMGDGFISLLDIVFMSFLAEGGAVFIEEPETSMHPGYSEIIARQIISSTERTQFFIATHSADLLEYLLDAGKDRLDLFKFVRFYPPDEESGFSTPEFLTGEEASEEIFEIRADLRGI